MNLKNVSYDFNHLTSFLLSMLLLVHSGWAHLFRMFFSICGAISKFVAVDRCTRNINLGGSDAREVGTNAEKTAYMYLRLKVHSHRATCGDHK